MRHLSLFVGVRDENLQSLLHHVACIKSVDFLAKVVRLNPASDINARDIGGNTPLFNFFSDIDQDLRRAGDEVALCFHLLQSHGADLTAKDRSGNTILHYAACSDQTVNLLPDLLVGEKKPDVHAVNSNGQTVLHVLCKSSGGYTNDDNEVVIMESLLARGININAKDDEGNTALHCLASSSCRDSKLVQLMLNHQASTSETNNKGYTPLQAHVYSLHSGRDSAITILLTELAKENKADFAHQDGGNTMLHHVKESIRLESSEGHCYGRFKSMVDSEQRRRYSIASSLEKPTTRYI